MKKIIIAILVICTMVLYFDDYSSKGIAEDVSEKIIRFHVVANSDEEKDQEVKLKVRDNVISFMKDKLSSCKDIDESRKVLIANSGEINKIAAKTLKDNGITYSTKSLLTKGNFPVKEYGEIVLPEGSYEAFQIILGEGEGHNWWCVMFPPLCFIDITKGEASISKTKDEMEKVLSDKELNFLTNDKASEKIILKFKILEVIKDILQKNK